VQLTVVGSGTAAPEADRVCSGYFLDDGATRILLDCGPGVVHHLARFGLPWPALDHLAITHFHNDHLGDLPMLLFSLKWGLAEPREAPLTVWGPAGLASRMWRLASAIGDHVLDPGFPLRILELADGDAVHLRADLELRAARTPHTPESLAFRVDGPGGSVGYTGDTGPSSDVAHFLGGCDLLVAECSLPDDAAIPTHLSPVTLAALAAEADPRRLLVTHVYPQLDALDPVALVAGAGWEGATERATDGLRIDLDP
jgi:ribonuclease BN (tRNA processing enzyme)